MDAKYLAEIKARIEAYQRTLQTGENAFNSRVEIEKYAYTDLKFLLADNAAKDQQIATLEKALELACYEVAKNSQYAPSIPDGCAFSETTIQTVARDYQNRLLQQAQQLTHESTHECDKSAVEQEGKK